MARPIEYTEELIEKTRQYLLICEDEENKQLPTIEALSLYLDVSRTAIYDWCTKYPEFSYIIDRLKANQANELIQRGLAGTYNPTITKVILTKHGYREGIDQTTNDKDLPTPILGNAILDNNGTEEDSKAQ